MPLLTSLLAALLLAAPGAAEPAGGWPVPGEDAAARPRVVRLFEPPPEPWAAGHRGVDLATRAGAPVRAAAGGRVSFAGRVAGRGVLTIELAGTGSPPLRLTHEPVGATVAEGERVTAGEVVGALEAGPFHCAGPCLHWGLRRGEAYLDPLSLLPPGLLRAGPARLLPVDGVPLPGAGGPDEGPAGAAGLPPPATAAGPGAGGVSRRRRPRAWRAAGARTWCGSG